MPPRKLLEDLDDTTELDPGSIPGGSIAGGVTERMISTSGGCRPIRSTACDHVIR